MIDLDHKRIVVTYLMHLGDLVFTTPFLHVLRKAAPHSHITYVVDKKLADIVRHNPHIDAVVEVDKKGADNSIGALRRVGKSLRAEGVDVVINLHPNERTSFLAWQIGAPITVGDSHPLFRWTLTKHTPLKWEQMHAAAMYVDVLAQLGVRDLEEKGYEIHSCAQWDAVAQQFFQEAGRNPQVPLIGINAGSAMPEKRWPEERFARVADHFMNDGYEVVFFGGPMDVDMVQRIVAQMEHSPMVATGKFGLGELAAAMKHCDLFISGDSGPMHMAVSQQVPIVALYGPSNPNFFGPYTENAIVLESMDHYEPGKTLRQIIREGSYRGIDVISTESVIQGAETLLKKNGKGL